MRYPIEGSPWCFEPLPESRTWKIFVSPLSKRLAPRFRWGYFESMIVELKPETERLVQEEIMRGPFLSVDEVIVQGVYALREKSELAKAAVSPRKPHKKLYDLLTQPPFAGSELDLKRQKHFPKPVDL